MPIEKTALVHGRRIAYVSSGEGEDVILLHGLGGSRLNWSGNLRALSARARVFALDQIGFGRSDKPPIAYTASEFADHLEGFMSAVGIARASLVGNSLGGEVAMRLALRSPGRVSRLVLVASGGMRRNEEERTEDAEDSFSTLDETRAHLESFFHDAGLVTEDLVRFTFENQNRYGDAETIRRFGARRAIEPPLDEPDLAGIAAPTLVLWGRQDRVTPLSLGERISRAIPGARLVVIEECGHLPQIEKGAEFNRIVLEFLGRPSGS